VLFGGLRQLSSNELDRSIIESELLEGIEGEWTADISHLMNEIFGQVAQLLYQSMQLH
jgi:hypothetical protein